MVKLSFKLEYEDICEIQSIILECYDERVKDEILKIVKDFYPLHNVTFIDWRWVDL